jgi:hypothetical protein
VIESCLDFADVFLAKLEGVLVFLGKLGAYPCHWRIHRLGKAFRKTRRLRYGSRKIAGEYSRGRRVSFA